MAARLYMDATLTLNRSLSPRGFKVLFGLVVTANVLFAVFLLVLGAWPAPMFLGLDVLAVWIAFRASFRAAERAERVQVSAEEVRVMHEDGQRRRTVWRSPTAFTRVDFQTLGEHDTRVRLLLSGRAFTLAKSLGPHERSKFANALQDAILQARAERY
jgi:uncharacterized membrane protein